VTNSDRGEMVLFWYAASRFIIIHLQDPKFSFSSHSLTSTHDSYMSIVMQCELTQFVRLHRKMIIQMKTILIHSNQRIHGTHCSVLFTLLCI